ncbi:putative ARS binding protein Abp2 [Aspergillus sclerotioniger CBS 115572]|uniref:Putative ARS binding protein Abp2 n=1 Tax=Aspergillus sclerotioniger CBS 115572 TaxID=1450535 RepID=A0A317X8K0_9EURO|nr:putative ARS binding protein Abp2 [Aspergillus sclerotioniger CBS 115572]PWY94926.1 putative ARS binding protein Abp2 [Aspergillus sclerotioniger CBS 115572]
MDPSFSNVMNQPVPPDRTELGPPPTIVIQQYARYPPTLEPGLHSASSLGSARTTPRSLQASPTGPRPVVPPPPVARSGPSISPPMYDSIRPRPPRESLDQTETRSLPSRDLTDGTIDDAYILFIFYCNPNVPLSVDTSELRKNFRCPPRSDGKTFSIFALWGLIRKLDSKEIKTWIQLAIELGVEPPSMEKKQSTQKVQQYAVRLKRWMRAMHVDAFFEYCLGHPHPYYTHLPPSNVISDSRDGVPLEEDLALRALVPQWRPKRGRKRAEDDSDRLALARRPPLDPSVGVLQSGPFPGASAPFPPGPLSFSPFPDEMESNDPWMGSGPSFPPDGASESQSTQPNPDLRWRPIERDASPAGYSAIAPRSQQPSDVFIQPADPRSMVSLSSGEKTRPKRRHGPAVSSAWPSNNGSNGKTRGRPPNRGTVSGPFSSFPVNPNRTDSSHLRGPGLRTSPAMILEQDPSNRFNNSPFQQSPTPFSFAPKLQLPGPPPTGTPVRLATPPTLMVNGVNSACGSLMKMEGGQRNGTLAPLFDSIGNAGVTNPSSYANRNSVPHADISSDEVVRVLSSELLRGKTIGRPTPLSADEARALSVSVVSSLTTTYAKLPAGLAALMSALHLGLGQQFGYPGVTDSSMTVNVESGPAVISDTPGTDGSPNFVYTISHEYKHGLRFSTKVTYGDLSISTPDSLKPDITPGATDEPDTSVAEADSLTDAEFEVDGADSSNNETTWKQRYMKLRVQMQRKERTLSQYKRKILESVMADI